jgi:hypothetical protein
MEKSPKISQKFNCENCDYHCNKKSEYDKHLLTRKHKVSQGLNVLEPKISKNLQFICDKCNKNYKARNSLWYHQKICSQITYDEIEEKVNEDDIQIKNEVADKDLIMLLIKENSELKNLMMEVIKTGTNNTTNNTTNNNTTHTNSHNKTFNLNVFLNETCKDAMNINDFIDSIQLQVSDLINVGEVGFVEGISNIIVKNLDKLDVTQRPVHCTDKKREVVYIKDDNKWEKEDDQKKRLRKAIKKIANKNERMLFKYKEKYPDCVEAESRRSDQYNKIIIEAMGGHGDNDTEKEDKIIRNITKKVTIDKDYIHE